MADILVAVTSFGAALMFARYLETERRRDALWSGLLALLALQSKPSAVSLLAVAVLGLSLCRRWHLLKQAPLWLAALVVSRCTIMPVSALHSYTPPAHRHACAPH